MTQGQIWSPYDFIIYYFRGMLIVTFRRLSAELNLRFVFSPLVYSTPDGSATYGSIFVPFHQLAKVPQGCSLWSYVPPELISSVPFSTAALRATRTGNPCVVQYKSLYRLDVFFARETCSFSSVDNEALLRIYFALCPLWTACCVCCDSLQDIQYREYAASPRWVLSRVSLLS